MEWASLSNIASVSLSTHSTIEKICAYVRLWTIFYQQKNAKFVLSFLFPLSHIIYILGFAKTLASTRSAMFTACSIIVDWVCYGNGSDAISFLLLIEIPACMRKLENKNGMMEDNLEYKRWVGCTINAENLSILSPPWYLRIWIGIEF